MPKMTAQHLADRRDQILDAAVACFAERGYHGSSMRDLIAGAGLSAGAIYHYFPGKDAILLALAERDLARFRALVSSLRAAGDARRALSSLVDEVFGGLGRPDARHAARLATTVLAEAAVNPATATPVRALHDAWRVELAALVGSAGTSSLAPDAVAAGLVHLHQGALAALAIGEPVDAQALAALARTLLGLSAEASR